MRVLWFKRKVLFKEIALEILEQKKFGAPNTLNAAKFRLTRLIGYFGEIPFSEIDEAHWHGFLAARLKERPGCKFFDDRKYFQQTLLEAQRRGLMSRTLRLKTPDLPSIAGREIKDSEIRRLFKHASTELRFQMEIAWKMGVRRGELISLRWDQLDWDRKAIQFLPADTKTRRPRVVPINPDLLQRFRRRHLQRKSNWVFPKKDLSGPRIGNRTAWRICKRKAGVSARWQDWRHTAATQMLRAGNSVQSVKTYLGNSEKILLKIYAHLDLDDLRKVANRMSKKRR